MKPSSLMTTAAATVGLVLAILVTRVEHFGTAFTPADATLAVLFLAVGLAGVTLVRRPSAEVLP